MPTHRQTKPPKGQIQLLSLAGEFRITLQALADACRISRTAMSRIAWKSDWPATRDQAELRAAVEREFTAAGATPEQCQALWLPVPPPVPTSLPPLRHPNNTTTATTATQEEPPMIIAKQTLTTEARRHFKLFANPFDGEVQTDAQMFQGGDVAYVREAAWQCARTASFVAIVGESGSGKTTIVGDLEARIEQDAKDCIVIRPGVLGMEGNNNKGKTLKSADILDAIIKAIDDTANVPMTLQARTRKAERMLTDSTKVGNSHLLVIEEAHSLPDATLSHLKRLHEMRNGRKNMLGILLVAQPELHARIQSGLRGGQIREVAQRLEIVQVLPLDADLPAYLAHRAQVMNRKLDEFIEPAAIDALRQRLIKTDASSSKRRAISLAYPLAVNNWMTRLLNETAAIGVPCITADVVRAC